MLVSRSLSAELTKGINYRVIGMLQICEMIQREISKVITLNEFKALISGPLKQPYSSADDTLRCWKSTEGKDLRMGVRCVGGVFVCVWEVSGGSEIALNNMFKDVLNYFAG